MSEDLFEVKRSVVLWLANVLRLIFRKDVHFFRICLVKSLWFMPLLALFTEHPPRVNELRAARRLVTSALLEWTLSDNLPLVPLERFEVQYRLLSQPTAAWTVMQINDTQTRRASLEGLGVHTKYEARLHVHNEYGVRTDGPVLEFETVDGEIERQIHVPPPPPNNINTAHRGRFQVNVNPVGDSK